MTDHSGCPLFYSGLEGASIGFRKLIRKLRDHIELGAPSRKRISTSPPPTRPRSAMSPFASATSSAPHGRIGAG
jgi:hypothetical protein